MSEKIELLKGYKDWFVSKRLIKFKTSNFDAPKEYLCFMNSFVEKWRLLMKENLDNKDSDKLNKMKTSEIVIRQLLIINKLRRGDSTFTEISDYLQEESEIQSLDLNISQRTFQRELISIATVYDIEITFDRVLRKYKIDVEFLGEKEKRILEAVDLFNALNIKERLSKHLLFEIRNSLGTQYLYSILKAIEGKNKIQFNHQKFSEEISSVRVIEPYVLKEFKHRWYVVGLDTIKEEIRIFGMDRITNLKVLTTKYKSTKFDASEFFKNSFGVITPNYGKPIDIKLSFTPYQASYFKTIPLHHSQKILSTDSKKVIISLHLVPTYDFIMELLSFGSELMSVQPKKLRKQILDHHKKGISSLNK